ncbi:MAG: hypothetical protein ABL917_00360 [Parcubacteria group bacterium]
MLSQEVIEQKEIERLSIEKCKELLGEDGENMSDKQVEEFRDALYTLVDNVLDKYLEVSNVCHEHE